MSSTRLGSFPSDSNHSNNNAYPLSSFQPIPIATPAKPRKKRRGCFTLLFMLLLLSVFYPLRVNLAVLGVDRAPKGTAAGRTDTIILVTAPPFIPRLRLLSIPRDLWVAIPGVGENRINTAHFFAEAAQPGTGPKAALAAIEQNFGIRMPYYVRFQFQGFVDILTALGGVTIRLEEPMSGYEAGKHHLDPTQALAFVRDRKGSDDFARMRRGQMMVRAVAGKLLNPLNWWRIPVVAGAALRALDTNIPIWLYPRLGVSLIVSAVGGLDGQTLTREMVTPYTTSEGANVLLPVWERILPVVQKMFR